MKNIIVLKTIRKSQDAKQEKMAITATTEKITGKITEKEKLELGKTLKILFLLLGVPLLLSGCMGMNSKFDCNVSSDGKCASMGTIHKMADVGEFNEYSNHRIVRHGNIANANRIGSNNIGIGNSNSNNKYPTQRYFSNISSTASYPLRSSETIKKIWIGPYEDENSNYHEATHVYAVIKKAQWLAESEQAIKD